MPLTSYLAWKDAKISAALSAARAQPENRVPQADVWKKFGLGAGSSDPVR